jgi:hypothetical protein
MNNRKVATVQHSPTMFTQRGEGRGGSAVQLQNMKGRVSAQGRRGGNQEDKTKEAESRDGESY